MKNLAFLILLLIICSLLKGQDLKLSKVSKKEFLVGHNGTVITKQPTEKLNYLLTNKINLILDGNEIEYQVTQLADTLLKWDFGIPSFNSLVGKDKNLIFDDGTNKQDKIIIDIYSNKPELVKYSTNIMYHDVIEPQNLTFTLNNVAFVDKIEFTDKKIQIDGTNLNSITPSSYGFNSNPINNTISINILPNDCNNFDILLYYTGKSTYQSSAPDTIQLRISKQRKYLHKRYKIITATSLYLDDFETQKYKPKIIFDFESLNAVAGRYTINIESSDIEIKTLTGEIEFDMPQNKKQEVEITDVKASGIYDIKISNNSGETFSSTLNILPKPNITGFKISNSSDNKIEKDLNKIYSVILKGTGLHKMSEVQVELVNLTTSQAYTLIKQPNIEENSINTQIKFVLTSKEEIPIGNYFLRLSRELKETQIKRIYPIYNPLISIVHPKIIVPDQVKQISLYEPKFFKEDSIPKKYKSLKSKILSKDSRITLKVSPIPENTKAGPQNIKVTAKYYKSDGNEVVLNVTEGGKDYVTIYDKPVFIDLKEEFAINEFNVNEKIKVTFAHSPEIYGSNKISPINEITYYRGSSFMDKIGITVTIPPYLAAFRNVKRKTITEDENNNIDVKYDGESKIEFQSLAINAGIGFKYRNKNKHYEPSRFALGLYLMGLDFANSNSVEEQRNEKDNHNFIGRGSFNLMFLTEFSFLNLDNPNTRIPVYLGAVYIFDPIDGGSNLAPVFGFGIDIKLFGSN